MMNDNPLMTDSTSSFNEVPLNNTTNIPQTTTTTTGMSSRTADLLASLTLTSDNELFGVVDDDDDDDLKKQEDATTTNIHTNTNTHTHTVGTVPEVTGQDEASSGPEISVPEPFSTTSRNVNTSHNAHSVVVDDEDDEEDDIFASSARQKLMERSVGVDYNDLFGGNDVQQEEEEEDDMPFADDSNAQQQGGNVGNKSSTANTNTNATAVNEFPIMDPLQQQIQSQVQQQQEDHSVVQYRDHSANAGIFSGQQQHQQHVSYNYAGNGGATNMHMNMNMAAPNANANAVMNMRGNNYTNMPSSSTASVASSITNSHYTTSHNTATIMMNDPNHNVATATASSFVIPPKLPTKLPPVKLPPLAPPKFKSVHVSNPILIHSGGGFFSSHNSYWSFEVTSTLNPEYNAGRIPPAFLNGQASVSVRRRFRHFVSLEEKLREACRGCILPPRPDKHATRAIEEAGGQSEEFALSRARELDEYMSLVALHPKAGFTDELTLFLTLADDIGTAWPDVSSNALTRLTEGTQNLVKHVTGNADKDFYQGENGLEDDASLLALSCQESLRIGAISQAVPKLEGALVLLKEFAEKAGDVGVELNRVVLNVGRGNKQIRLGPKEELDAFSGAMLRSGRRSKRSAMEAVVALRPFVYQYKICRNVRIAFADRRKALGKKVEMRDRADEKAHRLLSYQYQMNATQNTAPQAPVYNPYGNEMANTATSMQMELERMEMEAATSDEAANASANEAVQVGTMVKEEVTRLAETRRKEWMSGMKILAASMKEAAGEQRAIWEAALVTMHDN